MKLKQIPEDFIVREKLKLEINDGNYSYYLLKKINYNTNDAIETIARKLRIKPKLINAAGLKDKRAITYQYISIFNGPARDFEFNDIYLEYKGRGKNRINVGSLDGNHFEIVVRDIKEAPRLVNYVPNYFDQQRFGHDNKNHLIGRLLVKKDFQGAIELLEEPAVNKHLQKKPNDFVGALRQIPKRKLQFFVSAYQSFLWNKAIEKYLESSPDKDDKFPVPGFNVEVEAEKKEVLDKVLFREGIQPREFINRRYPELSCDGYERRVFTKIQDLKVGELEEDELNSANKISVSFFLEKGNYATNVISFIFS